MTAHVSEENSFTGVIREHVSTLKCACWCVSYEECNSVGGGWKSLFIIEV